MIEVPPILALKSGSCDRIEFTGGDLFQRSGMKDIVDSYHRCCDMPLLSWFRRRRPGVVLEGEDVA